MIDLFLWGLSFLVAVLLAFPPKIIRKRFAYFVVATAFASTQIYLQWVVFKMLSSPGFDDGAGAMLASPIMLFPTLLLFLLLVIRFSLFVIRKLTALVTPSEANRKARGQGRVG